MERWWVRSYPDIHAEVILRMRRYCCKCMLMETDKNQYLREFRHSNILDGFSILSWLGFGCVKLFNKLILMTVVSLFCHDSDIKKHCKTTHFHFKVHKYVVTINSRHLVKFFL